MKRLGTKPLGLLVRLILAIGIFHSAFAAADRQAAAISVGGRSVVIVQPEGFCWLDLNGSEGPMAQQAAAIFSKTGQELLAMFADCKELKLLRSGKVTTLKRHGSFTADANRRGLVVPTKLTRREVISQTATQLSKASIYSDSLNNLKRAANQVLPGTILEMSVPRVISQDQNAIYVGGIVGGRSSLGVNRLIATVTNTSVLQGLVINLILHDEVKSDPYNFSSLLRESRALAAELVRLNPTQ
jgi:hypothetical protein